MWYVLWSCQLTITNTCVWRIETQDFYQHINRFWLSYSFHQPPFILPLIFLYLPLSHPKNYLIKPPIFPHFIHTNITKILSPSFVVVSFLSLFISELCSSLFFSSFNFCISVYLSTVLLYCLSGLLQTVDFFIYKSFKPHDICIVSTEDAVITKSVDS